MTEGNETAVAEAPAKEEQKLVRMEGTSLVVSKKMELDPNKDGEPVAEIDITVKIHLDELPDELYDMWKKRKEK